MQAKLICEKEMHGHREFLIRSEATIGKGSVNDIVIKQKAVSRRHARIYCDKERGCFFIEDLKSQNGIWLDGQRVKRRQQLNGVHSISLARKVDFLFITMLDDVSSEELGSAHKTTEEQVQEPVSYETRIDLGDSLPGESKTTFQSKFWDEPATPSLNEIESEEAMSGNVGIYETVIQEDWGQTQTPPAIDTKTSPLVASLPRLDDNSSTVLCRWEDKDGDEHSKTGSLAANEDRPQFYLNFKKDNKKFGLMEGRNIIGRGGLCDVVINDSTVSKQHACISIQNEVISLNDLKSKNRTFVGRRQVASTMRVRPNTLIKFGNVEAVLGYA